MSASPREKDQQPQAGFRYYLSFLKAAIRSPLGVGTIFPSSPQLSQAMLDFSNFESAKSVVELGPGTGAITQPLYNQMPEGQQYVGIEMNAEMVAALTTRFPHMRFIEGSAEGIVKALGGEARADLVISSLPWTLFSPEFQQKLLNEIKKALRPGGEFVTYVCLNAMVFPSAGTLKKALRSTFGSYDTSPMVWMNVPPAMIYRVRRPA